MKAFAIRTDTCTLKLMGLAWVHPWVLPTLTSFTACHLEDDAFTKLTVKTRKNCRYLDDCFLVLISMNEFQSLKSNSVLSFTFEAEIERKLPFLDVLLHRP